MLKSGVSSKSLESKINTIEAWWTCSCGGVNKTIVWTWSKNSLDIVCSYCTEDTFPFDEWHKIYDGE